MTERRRPFRRGRGSSRANPANPDAASAESAGDDNPYRDGGGDTATDSAPPPSPAPPAESFEAPPPPVHSAPSAPPAASHHESGHTDAAPAADTPSSNPNPNNSNGSAPAHDTARPYQEGGGRFDPRHHRRGRGRQRRGRGGRDGRDGRGDGRGGGPPRDGQQQRDGQPREAREPREQREFREQPPAMPVVADTDVRGWFDLTRDAGYLRQPANSYLAVPGDPWVPPPLMRQFALR